MTDPAAGWTLVFKDGAPADWARAAASLQRGAPGQFALADATRAVRQGGGLVDLLLTEAQARAIEASLTDAGFTARAMARSELEAAELPVRHARVDFAGEEAVPGLPWKSLHVVHLALVQAAPFSLPVAENASLRSAQRVASAVSIGAKALGVTDFGVFDAVGGAAARSVEPSAPVTSAPELVVELVGLWTPRVHLVVDSFEYTSVPGVVGAGGGGRRARLAALLEAVLAKAPGVRREGLVQRALAKQSLEGLVALESATHRRLISAWLTSKRLWP